MKRAGIFCFYNEEGIVRKYVIHLLTSMAKYYSDLFIVCNGLLKDEGRKILSGFTDRIFVRENEGYDAAAFKYVILEKLGKEGLASFDELLIFNDTFYGPFFSMDEIFEKMDDKDCDFWGLTAYNTARNDSIPYHVQSYFVNYKSRLIHSDLFTDFWSSLSGTWDDVKKCIRDYEMKMTPFFEEQGFRSSVFIDKEYSRNYYADYPYNTIYEYRLPIIKKKIFTLPMDSFHNLESRKAYEYMINNFDCSYIFDDLLTIKDINYFRMRLGFSFIVKPEKKANRQYRVLGSIDDRCLNEQIISDINSIVDEDIVLVYLPDLSGLNDKEKAIIKENLFSDERYISGILKIFKDRSEAGCLVPELFKTENALRTVSRSYDNYGSFWIRGRILKALIKKTGTVENTAGLKGEELASAIQKEGYITYSVRSEAYAGIAEGLARYYLSELTNALSRNHDFNDIDEALEVITNDRLHLKRIKHIINNAIKKD